MLLFHECSETFAKIFEKFIKLWHPNVAAVCLDVRVCMALHTSEISLQEQVPIQRFRSTLGNKSSPKPSSCSNINVIANYDKFKNC